MFRNLGVQLNFYKFTHYPLVLSNMSHLIRLIHQMSLTFRRLAECSFRSKFFTIVTCLTALSSGLVKKTLTYSEIFFIVIYNQFFWHFLFYRVPVPRSVIIHVSRMYSFECPYLFPHCGLWVSKLLMILWLY